MQLQHRIKYEGEAWGEWRNTAEPEYGLPRLTQPLLHYPHVDSVTILLAGRRVQYRAAK